MRWPIVLAIIGIGAELVGIAAPQYWPNAPEWIWGTFVWGGIAVIIGAIIGGVWPYQRSIISALPWTPRLNRVPLIELRDAMARRGWDFQTETSLHILDFCKALRQGGIDGAIAYWGRPDRNLFPNLTQDEPLNVIPMDHWKDFEIDPISLHRTEDNSSVRTYYLSGQSRQGYLDLHTDKNSALRWLKRNEKDFKGKEK